MNEFSRKPAHAVLNWQALTSTGKLAGHRRVARWRVPGVKPGSGSPPKGGGTGLPCPAVPVGGGSGGGRGSGGFCGGGGLASSALRWTCATLASSVPDSSAGRGRVAVSRPGALNSRVERGGFHAEARHVDVPLRCCESNRCELLPQVVNHHQRGVIRLFKTHGNEGLCELSVRHSGKVDHLPSCSAPLVRL